MKKLILLSFLFLNISYAKEVTKNINVSATIIYNCSVPNEKTKNFCEEKQKPIIKIENGYLVKEY